MGVQYPVELSWLDNIFKPPPFEGQTFKGPLFASGPSDKCLWTVHYTLLPKYNKNMYGINKIVK